MMVQGSASRTVACGKHEVPPPAKEQLREMKNTEEVVERYVSVPDIVDCDERCHGAVACSLKLTTTQYPLTVPRP